MTKYAFAAEINIHNDHYIEFYCGLMLNDKIRLAFFLKFKVLFMNKYDI